MATPQQQYDETKLRLDNNLKKAQLLNQEIAQKEIENQQAIKIVQEIEMLRNEAQSLVQPIIEDQGALKVLSNTDGVITKQTVESN
tara:strand:+ start:1306 stop:1563 length:258 start_codon:yes stop_codon:yes gene_type:complete